MLVYQLMSLARRYGHKMARVNDLRWEICLAEVPMVNLGNFLTCLTGRLNKATVHRAERIFEYLLTGVLAAGPYPQGISLNISLTGL